MSSDDRWVKALGAPNDQQIEDGAAEQAAYNRGRRDMLHRVLLVLHCTGLACAATGEEMGKMVEAALEGVRGSLENYGVEQGLIERRGKRGETPTHDEYPVPDSERPENQ